ncbi:splicing regulator SDE2 [Phymastichus coffea]|uniref:splicing regulator SDE2 n=1 Tax=Phymastichus coffea TaxID=108790 RepID=UPI00273C6CAA|nr:splicing regulator SDE2 [Phymastichus coffea]
MSTVYLQNNDTQVKVMEVCVPTTGKQLMNQLTNITNFKANNFFLKNNGCLVMLDNVIYKGDIILEPKLFGGKGGFGSMLRAIGAQIEKTTNREACRDLSGRRLRDINEEKRLKAWIDKQANREEEAAERKKKKLEKLRAVPKHEFKDKCYEEQRSILTERVEDAVEVGFATAASTSAGKRVLEQGKTNPKKKLKTILDDDLDSDELSSSDNEDEKMTDKKQKFETDKSDSENSSINQSNSNVDDAVQPTDRSPGSNEQSDSSR